MSTAEEILAAGARPREPFDLNGTKMWLQSLAFGDYGPWLKGGEIRVDVASVTRMLARAIVDEDGRRVFSDKDAKKLGDLEPTAVMAMFNKVMELSSLTAEAQENDAEDFGEARSGESSTG
jgi:hypothetical protein